jgi:hypothetical protein
MKANEKQTAKTQNKNIVTPQEEKKETPKTKYKDTTTETAEQRTKRKAEEKAERIAKRVQDQKTITAEIMTEIITENQNYKQPTRKRYTEIEKNEVLNNIFNHISNGNSLHKSLRLFKLSTEMFYLWIDMDFSLSQRYARAHEKRADALFDKSIDMAATIPDVNRARLVVDTLKWVAGKLNPQKYSDKQNINIISNTNNNILNLSSDEREAKILELMNKANLISE